MYKDKRVGGTWNKPKKFDRNGGKGGFDRPELHDATCSVCGNPCKVPFRPNGSKPIYCRDCFKRSEGDTAPNKRFDRPTFGAARPTPGAKRPYVSTPRTPDLSKIESRLKAIEDKLDALIEALENAE